MTVGKRIKDRRQELNMSVDELARRLNKNRTTIYRYEKGDIENLPIDILEPLAKALDTTPAYLMGWNRNDNKRTQEFEGSKGSIMGTILKMLRIENNVSLEEISKELDISIATLNRYESGEEQIPLNILNMIASYLKVSLSKIIGVKVEEDENKSVYFTMSEKNAKHFKNWYKAFKHAGFTDEEHEKLIEYGKFLISQRKQ